jgi:hypothetical protein
MRLNERPPRLSSPGEGIGAIAAGYILPGWIALGGVVSVDPYVLSRQISGQEPHRIRTSPQLQANVADRFGEGAVSAS